VARHTGRNWALLGGNAISLIFSHNAPVEMWALWYHHKRAISFNLSGRHAAFINGLLVCRCWRKALDDDDVVIATLEAVLACFLICNECDGKVSHGSCPSRCGPTLKLCSSAIDCRTTIEV
jgi:hypothetical protein